MDHGDRRRHGCPNQPRARPHSRATSRPRAAHSEAGSDPEVVIEPRAVAALPQGLWWLALVGCSWSEPEVLKPMETMTDLLTTKVEQPARNGFGGRAANQSQ